MPQVTKRKAKTLRCGRLYERFIDIKRRIDVRFQETQYPKRLLDEIELALLRARSPRRPCARIRSGKIPANLLRPRPFDAKDWHGDSLD